MITYTIRIQTSGSYTPALFEGDYDACMNLAHAAERFPNDTMNIKVYHEDGDDLVYDYTWQSPEWVG
jgi:hypothetical protein